MLPGAWNHRDVLGWPYGCQRQGRGPRGEARLCRPARCSTRCSCRQHHIRIWFVVESDRCPECVCVCMHVCVWVCVCVCACVCLCVESCTSLTHKPICTCDLHTKNSINTDGCIGMVSLIRKLCTWNRYRLSTSLQESSHLTRVPCPPTAVSRRRRPWQKWGRQRQSRRGTEPIPAASSHRPAAEGHQAT